MAQASRIQAESINHIMNDASSANAVGPRSGRCGRATAQSLEDMAIVDELFLVGPEYFMPLRGRATRLPTITGELEIELYTRGCARSMSVCRACRSWLRACMTWLAPP